MPTPARAALLESLFDEIRDYGLVALGPDGVVGDWSVGAAALTGRDADDAIGRAASDALWAGREAGGPRLAELLADVADRGSRILEGWIVRPDGTRAWLEEVWTALRAGVDVVGYAVLLRDRTEWKSAFDALEEARRTFEGILAIGTDAVICVDEAQRITFFSRGAEEIFGYSADEVAGEPLDVLIPEPAREPHRRHVGDFAASGVTARRMGERGRIQGRRKSGEIFPAEASISQIEIGGRRIYTAVLRDVTDRREAEEALAAHARELARSNAELEQFAYVASHDLQEPLRMVASYTKLLGRRYRGRLDADADEFIDFAVDGVTRMQALINDLLAYSRVGRSKRPFADVDMSAVVQGVLQDLETGIADAGATVTADRLPVVRGDRAQLAQLVQNLISNAIKFRGEEPPRVHLSARRDGPEWQFSVRDNGIGIAPEYAERIFAVFQRLHGRGEYPGTGIGLSICRKVVEHHGGRIWVESAEGEGAAFHFTLPATEGESQ